LFAFVSGSSARALLSTAAVSSLAFYSIGAAAAAATGVLAEVVVLLSL